MKKKPTAKPRIRFPKPLTLAQFQKRAGNDRTNEPITIDYTAVRLAEEAGEVLGVAKRHMRKIYTGNAHMTKRDTARLQDEMGDVLHALSKLADAAGLDLEEIARQSLDKQK